MALSIAEVAALIAGGVFVLRVLIPLAIPWALTAFMSHENSVITWTVLGRFLHSSLWPTILNSSTAGTAGVPWRVYMTSWAQTILLFLVTIASVISPLGLYNSIEPATSLSAQPFQYIQDTSAFGYGTQERRSVYFTRVCGFNPCPGTTVKDDFCFNPPGFGECDFRQYEYRIPADLVNLYNRGAAAFSPTVASIFDIQYRTSRRGGSPFGVLSWFMKADYRPMPTLVLDNEVKLIDGLIADVKDGGIGFRNHTAPREALEYGATWHEDILFMEPETECVPMNLSIYHIPPGYNQVIEYFPNMSIVDDGGFSNIARAAPDTFGFELVNGQSDLNLRDRAYRAAWTSNYYTMLFLNITDPNTDNITRVDSILGQDFDIRNVLNKNFTVPYYGIKTTTDFGTYFNFTIGTDRSINPYNVTRGDFAAAATACAGATYGSPANMDSSLIACGLLIGAGSRTDGGDNMALDSDSHWRYPLYSCATAVKVLVRTVEFDINGTDFTALKVRSSKPKEYPNSATVPIWGVESLQNYTLSDVRPLWGIVGPSTTDEALTSIIDNWNITTISSESLYLPGYMEEQYIWLEGDVIGDRIGETLPAVDIHSKAARAAYRILADSQPREADYSGQNNIAIQVRWRLLSQSAEGAAKLINLVWTDFVATVAVGTKGWGLSAASSTMAIPLSNQSTDAALAAPATTSTSVSVPIIIYGRHIRYRIPFGVPAFIILGATSIILTLLVALLAMRRTGISRLRDMLEASAIGRVLAPLIQPSNAYDEDKLGSWVQRVGDQKVTITREVITVESVNTGLLTDIELERT